MATASKPTAHPHLSTAPGVRGGRPCIDGTRITVMDIVILERMGLPPEEMRTHYSSRPLTLAEVHAALKYYYDHKAEIDASIEEDRQWGDGHEERRDEHLRQAGEGAATLCWMLLLLASMGLGGCGSNPATPTPSPTPTVAPTASPTPNPTPTPSPFGQCLPTPPPLTQYRIKIHSDYGFTKILDSSPLVGPDPAYCTQYGGYPGMYCTPRPEGDSQAIACDVLVTGYATDTGRPGPTWTKDGKPCVAKASDPGVAECVNHPDNQFLLIAKGPGYYQACSSPTAPQPNKCGGYHLCYDAAGFLEGCGQ